MSAETDHTTEHVPEWKHEEVAALVEVVESYESVGIVGVTGIPSRQLQQMRSDLHGSARLRMGRNTLIRRALDEVDEGLEALDGYVSGEVGIIGSNDNPFALFRKLEESKTPAPIGAGEVAPNDIVIEAGDTGMDPGPFVGDLQTVGANARIQDGSIKVLEDSLVCEAGEEVSADLAGVLGELGVEPKEVGLDLRAVFSEGVLFEPAELAIDVDEYRADFRAAAARAQNLSVNAAYPTARTADALLGKALGEAKSLGLQAAIESPDLSGELVNRADVQLRALAASIEDEEALPEALRGVEAPAAPAEPEEPTDEEPEAEEADADADEAAAEEEADDEPSGEGLGDLFG